MKINVFSSGSAGNVTLIRGNDRNILIDAGITLKSINENLQANGLTINDISALLITHEHDDHIRAIPTLLKYKHMVIYISQGTLNGLKDKLIRIHREKCIDAINERINEGSIVIIKRDEFSFNYDSISLGSLFIKVIPTFHDANEPIGFIITEGEKKLVYITDTGYVHQAFFKDLYNADCYVLESNHDPEILMHSDRPYYTKMRILSDHGHLSNEDSMILLAKLMGDKTRIVMHAHVSQECNLTQIIEMTRENVFNNYGICAENIEFTVLSPRPSKEYEI